MKAVCFQQTFGQECHCGSCQFQLGLRRKYKPAPVKTQYRERSRVTSHKQKASVRYTTENFRDLATGTRLKVFERDGGVCVACGGGDWLTLDHIKPRSKGGTNALHNLQTLCYDCNHFKADSHGDEKPRPKRRLVVVPEPKPEKTLWERLGGTHDRRH